MDVPSKLSRELQEKTTDAKMAADDVDETPPTTPVRRAQSLLPLPPDGGYGWVIVVACFICNGLVEGSVGSFGIFLPYFTEAFGTSRAKATIAGSLLIGGFMTSGVVVSGLINCFGCRVVAMVGSLLTVLAFILSTLSPNIDVFITIYGFIGGFGLAMIYLPAMVMVGYYFERRRAVATGIAYSGAGIGMVIMAPVCAGLVSAFDWRNALILLAGFPLQGIVLGALMRPLSAPSSSVEDPSETTLDSDNDEKALVSAGKPISSKSEPAVTSVDSTKLSNRLIGYNLYLGNNSPIANIKTQSMHTLELPMQIHEKHLQENLSPKTCSMVTQSCMDLPSEPNSRKKSLISYAIQNRNRAQTAQTQSTFISCQQLSQLPDDFLRQIDMHKLREEMSKPLARRDIFYPGSICDLEEYREQPDLRSYIASVTMIPREDMNESASPRCPCISKSSLTTLTEMMHFNLLFHPHFIIITLASVFIQLGYFIPIVFIPDYAVSLEIPEQRAALLISVIGLANTVGRAGGGALANISWVNPLHLNNICLILSGIATLLACSVCKTLPLLVIYAATFGLLMGTFVPLTTIFLVKYLGLHRLNNALGLLSMVKGLSSIAGPPIAGAMLDKNSSHGPVFYFAGSMFITAGCIFYLIPLCSRCTSPSTSTLNIESRLSSESQSLSPKDPEERMV